MFPCWGRPDTHPIKLPAAFCPDFPLSNEPCASHSKAVTISITVLTLQNQRLTQCCLVVSTKCCSRHIQKKAEKKKKKQRRLCQSVVGREGRKLCFLCRNTVPFPPRLCLWTAVVFQTFFVFFFSLFVCLCFVLLFVLSTLLSRSTKIQAAQLY